jgi:SAM-dependent methyltransferase
MYMARLSEHILYWLAKRFYRTEYGQSNDMRVAFKTLDKNTSYREAQQSRVLAAALRYGVELADKVALDLGCNTGALTIQYLKAGARRVVGVDIDAAAVDAATARYGSSLVEFHVSGVTSLPLADQSIDLIICFDVFEHVSQPAAILAECKRVLRNGGQMLIGTWGWYHPFAPHLFATMPVPWAHVFFSESTVLRTCRRVFHSPWYVPNMYDLDVHGKKKDKYRQESISTDYLNKYLIRDFERVFRQSGLDWRVHLAPFESRFARWTRVFFGVPYLREFVAAFLWAVLQKPADSPAKPGCTAEANSAHILEAR